MNRRTSLAATLTATAIAGGYIGRITAPTYSGLACATTMVQAATEDDLCAAWWDDAQQRIIIGPLSDKPAAPRYNQSTAHPTN